MRNSDGSRRRIPRLARELSLGSLSVTALLLAVCPQAQAADGPAGVPNYQGARQVLRSARVHDTVSRFLSATANVGADGGQQDAPMNAGARDNQQTFSVNDPVALYEITPGFVTGKARPTAAGALRLSYLAALVRGAGGHQATVLLSAGPRGTAWQLAGVRDGGGDIGYADQATADSTVFTEPQIHAWYRLKGGIVQPLNQEAVAAFGGKRTMSLGAYQQLVHGRYADKLPGSAYDRKGLAGGYGLAAPARPSTGPDPALLGGSGAALALVAVGGTVAVRRRTRSA
ncbi:hypothetical protein [Streptomyces sp. RPT161]|uniref:hypothetical protein n=1 Tax=Streptomyces sp. RPT161 TaxID=3015993 RepID=UPI0022B8F72A|nr:hypothetical protein [Streptomyces sp. RPT161]